MTIDIAKLKAAAEKATPGKWLSDWNSVFLADAQLVASVETSFPDADEKNAHYIASANPSAVLELIAALEAKDAQIAERDGTLEREREKSRRMASRIAELEARAVKLPAFEGYQEHIVRELQGAFRIACGNAGINLETGGE